MVKILARKITNLSDARYFAAMGVDWISFALNPEDAAHLPIEKVREIKSWIDGPKIFGEFGNINDMDWLQFMVEDLKLEGIVSNHSLAMELIQIAPHPSSFTNHHFVICSEQNIIEKQGSCLLHLQSSIDKFPLKDLGGIAIEGSEEEKVGFKNYDLLDQIFESLAAQGLRS